MSTFEQSCAVYLSTIETLGLKPGSKYRHDRIAVVRAELAAFHFDLIPKVVALADRISDATNDTFTRIDANSLEDAAGYNLARLAARLAGYTSREATGGETYWVLDGASPNHQNMTLLDVADLF